MKTLFLFHIKQYFYLLNNIYMCSNQYCILNFQLQYIVPLYYKNILFKFNFCALSKKKKKNQFL